MKNKKLDVHLVEHTHWDREWYFTSDDSRTMLYYDMKFMIEHLEKNQDNYTYDGQSSIIDDFLKYSPEWEERLKDVVKKKRLYVGPFYTAVDDTAAAGESISRNLEMGQYIAKSIGHSMNVGYLPDTFGHNNQIPQILKMNGLNNLSFYRGIDPVKINDSLYFIYKGLDGTEVLGHWQTHYTTRGFGPSVAEGQYTEKWFEDNLIKDYEKKGEFGPSVKSYEKRNFNLPIALPIGTDQRPYSKLMPDLTKRMNKKYEKYNFINSNYEDFLADVSKKIKENKIELPIFSEELRVSKTGRAHRTIASSRMDIKQLHIELENVLIYILEPMSVLCHKNGIDVPWKMIDEAWKSLHKSSAHDSYACSNEDPVNRKLKQRLWNSIRIARNVTAMLSRIYAGKFLSEKKDSYKKILLFNYKHSAYKGTYKFITTVEKEYQKHNFRIIDNGKEVKYTILHRNNVGTHERDAMTLLLHDVEIKPFTHKTLEIEYNKEVNSYAMDTMATIESNGIKISVNQDKLVIERDGKTEDKLIQFAFDASIGDTYDHSPITFNDKKYYLSNFNVIERINDKNTIRFSASVMIPNGIKGWTENKVSIKQSAIIQLTILDNKIHTHIEVENMSDNARMLFMVDAQTNSDSWYHDQQFGVHEREINNEYMKKWQEVDELGYKWQEYPTNLSPLQSFASNNEKNLTVYVYGTKEHEMIKSNSINTFIFTLYRAFGKFGTSKVAYRPGRASGANTDAPESQLKGNLLQFDFIVDFEKTSTVEKFHRAEEMHLKNFYIPSQWALHRTILRWNTNLEFYDSEDRSYNLSLSKAFSDNFVTSSIYRRMNGDVIARLLNVGDKILIGNSEIIKSRELSGFSKEQVTVPRYGLINVLLEKGN